jgi:tetratricopeptide (TPR) repeat protein
MLRNQFSATQILCGALFFISLLPACSPPEEREMQSALAEQKNRHFKEAVTGFERVILRNPESPLALIAAREGVKISFFELKDFKKAIEFNQRLVISSPDPAERQTAQELSAAIYFDQLADYPNAVKAINRLLTLNLSKEKTSQFKAKLARAYYFQNNFLQAESEATDLLRSEKDNEDVVFQMLVLKANVFLARKEINKATDILRDVMKKYPEKAVKENVAATLAVAFEETKDYKSAVLVLQAMKPYHPNPDLLEIRIQRLMQAQKNQPGAHGLRHK